MNTLYRIGVFFDGTNNANDTEDKKQGIVSNIAKLYDAYETLSELKKEDKIISSDKLYLRGVGRLSTEEMIDMASGGGGGERIYDALKQVKTLLQHNGYNERWIDVFGFSRGAAQARDFVNSFYLSAKEDKRYEDVRFNFIGLYDTVTSFGKAGSMINMKPIEPSLASESDGQQDDHDGKAMRSFEKTFKMQEEAQDYYDLLTGLGSKDVEIQQSTDYYVVWGTLLENQLYVPYNFNLSPASAKCIVHMKALDETRYNFSLTNIEGSGGKEYDYLGAHADIGGGYPPEQKEILSFRPHTNKIGSAPLDSYTYAKERVVDHSLALVTLHLMHEEAVKNDVPFLALKTEIPSDLEDYYGYLKQYQEVKEYTKISKIRDKYVHISAESTQIDTTGNTEGMPKNIVNLHIENEGGIRAVYENDPQKAIVPC